MHHEVTYRVDLYVQTFLEYNPVCNRRTVRRFEGSYLNLIIGIPVRLFDHNTVTSHF
jgi:hypothetical protein